MAITDTSTPAIGDMTIRVRPAKGGSDPVEFTRFLSYSYSESYLSPSDESNFEIAERELSPTDAAALQAGSVVQILVGGHVQSVGVIDDVEATVDRAAGSVVRVTCRDQLSIAVDAQVDPRMRFLPSQTLADVIKACYEPLGFTDFQISNEANRNIITGQTHGTATSVTGAGKRASPQGAKSLKNYVLHQEKPYPNEGVFQFTSRISQRFGLWIRPGAAAGTLIVAKPDFDQDPRYGLQHVYGAAASSNNIVRGTFRKSRQEQPSILIAFGVGGGGDFARTALRTAVVNPVVQADNSAIIGASYALTTSTTKSVAAAAERDATGAITNAGETVDITTSQTSYAALSFVGVPAVTAAFSPFIEAKARPAFLYDPESRTIEQLNSYILRELSLRLRKALTARYEIMGHMLNGQPIAVDTIVNVNDQRPTVLWQGPLWVLGRRYSKSAKDGTRTTLDLILPGSLIF